jgi:hypothetical protein
VSFKQTKLLVENSVKQKDLTIAENMEKERVLIASLNQEMLDLEQCLSCKELEWNQWKKSETAKNDELVSNLTKQLSALDLRSSDLESQLDMLKGEV